MLFGRCLLAPPARLVRPAKLPIAAVGLPTAKLLWPFAPSATGLGGVAVQWAARAVAPWGGGAGAGARGQLRACAACLLVSWPCRVCGAAA